MNSLGWKRISKQEQDALPNDQRAPEGIACPWCDRLIGSCWDKHAFNRDGQTFCRCPHCDRAFLLLPGEPMKEVQPCR